MASAGSNDCSDSQATTGAPSEVMPITSALIRTIVGHSSITRVTSRANASLSTARAPPAATRLL